MANRRDRQWETADLCRIAPHQARDLLSRLVSRGELVMEGRLKGPYYVRASKNMESSKRVLDVSKRSPKRGRNRNR